MERHQGFMAAISNFPDIKLIDKADAAWESGPAEVEMDSMLCRHPKIDAVYAHNDRIAPGAYRAAKKVGREKEMLFVGIDALPGKGNGLELVLDSVLNATFIYPTNGDKVMQLAMNILEKKPYPRETVMNTAVVDHTNAHVMQLQTTHISELDQKIETLNGRIGGYLSRVATQQVVMYGGLVILLLVAGLLLVVYKSLRSKNRLNRELSEQKKQLEEQRDKLEGQRDKLEEQRDQLIQLSHQLEEATHAKLVFFTNISHDFRTPLTLVADPVEHLLADKTLNGDQHRMLMLIQRNVNILLLWGYLCTITALVVYVLILITGNPLWNWLWLAIPVIGFPVMHWLKKKEDKPVLTYTDKVLLAIWSNIGQYGIGISIISALYFDSMLLLLPIILLLCSLGVNIMGSIINDSWMRNAAGCALAISVVMISHILFNPPEFNFMYPAFAVCFVIMLIIPGHRLNRRHTKE